MKNRLSQWILYLALVLLYLLHNDLWFWNAPQLVLGLPIGLLYHISFCVVASIVMILLVNYAWPHHLKTEDPVESE
ncbi:MAG: hypothetical protein ACE1ZS_04675 [Candidatus Poribacteria bacterium]